MAKNLLIVESPAKAKTIEGYLGKDFTVKSSYGHIRDLVKSEDAIDINNNFAQKYEVPADKKQVVSELKKLAKEAEMVWLASDEDREGEAISWHLFETLGLKDASTKRIVFHEITKPAILKAIENPRKIDYNLVNAQQARRVLDRLVGFELSPVLWKKVKPSLSAGRVQSVAVRLIVDREREINKFTAEAAYKIVAIFGKGKEAFKAELPERYTKQEDAEKFLRDCVGADFNISSLETKPTKRGPAAPFTTSTLQQEASRKLGYSVSRTMILAQKLYESGKITYMRTDSVNLSELAMDAAANQIKSQYGEKYHQARKFKNKNESAQEAHEAIRPTYMDAMTVEDADCRRLYELIWKRTMASQMADAELEKTIAKIQISTNKEELTASGEVLKFDGFLKVYMEDRDEDDITDEEGQEGILPPLTVQKKLPLKEMKAVERFTRPQPRYTEASLVKKLEELGIGRPSTYAPTISTILKRGYVEKRDKEGVKRDFRILSLKNDKIEKLVEQENTGAEKSKLFPTDLGLVVTDFLKQYFDDIMDYHFTARIEEEFDEVASGKLIWSKMIDDFYNPFKKDVDNTIENAERIKGERELGIDAQSGKKVIARMGRYGPMVQIGDVSDEEKPRFAKLKNTQSIETISYDEAMDLFRLPRNLGQFEDSDVVVNIGRFGPYVAHDKLFYSLGKELDPYSVTLEEMIPLITEKRQAKQERTIKVFEKEKIQLLRGPYGPYIKQGLRNFRLPKEAQEAAADLTIEEVKDIIEDVKANPPKRVPRTKKGG